MAEMSEIGFDAFLETETGFDAYIEAASLNRIELEAILQKYNREASLSVQEGLLPKVNWNEEWEKHYEPIIVENKVYVRATFHPPQPGFEHEIIINPKMSFGTGHHATTYLMLQLQLELDHKRKKVMDAGSGTGILAIMAGKLGAAEILAFDIDAWSVENGNENFQLNRFEDITMHTGTIREIKPGALFDIILANINKNVLLDEMEVYGSCLADNGYLLLSGFYETDIPDLSKKATEHGLVPVKHCTRDNWAALVFKKGLKDYHQDW
jgi:ribosomal protein L11 methyltransferase